MGRIHRNELSLESSFIKIAESIIPKLIKPQVDADNNNTQFGFRKNMET